MAGGRPSGYNEEIASEICLHIIEGLSLRSICSLEGMPSLKTIFNWIESNKEFLQQYTHARKIQADIKFDDLKDLAKAATPEDIQCVKLQIDTAKWELSKTLPKKYGDKVGIEHSGEVINRNIEIVLKEDIDAEDVGFIDS